MILKPNQVTKKKHKLSQSSPYKYLSSVKRQEIGSSSGKENLQAIVLCEKGGLSGNFLWYSYSKVSVLVVAINCCGLVTPLARSKEQLRLGYHTVPNLPHKGRGVRVDSVALSDSKDTKSPKPKVLQLQSTQGWL